MRTLRPAAAWCCHALEVHVGDFTCAVANAHAYPSMLNQSAVAYPHRQAATANGAMNGSAHSRLHRTPPWICTIAAVRSSDLAITGSSDGYIRLWRCDTSGRGALSQVNTIDVPGFVNGLAASSDGRFIVAAAGQEHRLGRWERKTEGRNRALIIPLAAAAAAADSEDSSSDANDDGSSGGGNGGSDVD